MACMESFREETAKFVFSIKHIITERYLVIMCLLRSLLVSDFIVGMITAVLNTG